MLEPHECNFVTEWTRCASPVNCWRVFGRLSSGLVGNLVTVVRRLTTWWPLEFQYRISWKRCIVCSQVCSRAEVVGSYQLGKTGMRELGDVHAEYENRKYVLQIDRNMWNYFVWRHELLTKLYGQVGLEFGVHPRESMVLATRSSGGGSHGLTNYRHDMAHP